MKRRPIISDGRACLSDVSRRFWVVATEAAAMEIPVVATKIPGCVDAVEENVTGTLVPPQDASALAAALRQYLRDPALCPPSWAAGRVRVLRDFRPERIEAALWQGTRAFCNKKSYRTAFPQPINLTATSPKRREHPRCHQQQQGSRGFGNGLRSCRRRNPTAKLPLPSQEVATVDIEVPFGIAVC